MGVPLIIDTYALNGQLGHYARILINVDLLVSLTKSITLENGDRYFSVNLDMKACQHFVRCVNLLVTW